MIILLCINCNPFAYTSESESIAMLKGIVSGKI